MAKKKRRKAAIVPPMGPATNLRPAGAHESLKTYNRKALKARLRQEIAEGDVLSRGFHMVGFRHGGNWV